MISLDPNQVSHEALIHTAGIKHIEIRLTDERNRLLDLNGLHTQIAIKFRFVNTMYLLGRSRTRGGPDYSR